MLWTSVVCFFGHFIRVINVHTHFGVSKKQRTYNMADTWLSLPGSMLLDLIATEGYEHTYLQ